MVAREKIVLPLPLILILCSASSLTAATAIDAKRLFQELDADRNGQVADDEVAADSKLLFKRLLRMGDEDGDTRLTAAEFSAAMEPVRAEKDLAEKMGSRLPGADALTVLLAKMDANHDRRLEAKEIPDRYQRLFEQMLRPADGDKDGNLNQREIAQAAPRLGIMAEMGAARLGLDVAAEFQKLPAEERAATDQMDAYGRPGQLLADPAQAAELFQRLDANGDNRISQDEAPPAMADRFSQMLARGDQDRDDQLNKKEFLDLSRRMAEFERVKPDQAVVRRSLRQLMNRFDRNGDGQLTAKEAPPRLVEGFDRFDRDANGSLDRSELMVVAEAMGRSQAAGGRAEPAPDQASRPKARPTETDSQRARQKARKRRP